MPETGPIHSGFQSRDLQPRPITRHKRPAENRPGREAQAPRREPDRIELSNTPRAGRDAGAPLRSDMVLRISEEIDRGVYETTTRIEGAVEAMLRREFEASE